MHNVRLKGWASRNDIGGGGWSWSRTVKHNQHQANGCFGRRQSTSLASLWMYPRNPFYLFFPIFTASPPQKRKEKKERKDPATSAQRCVDSKHMCYISPAWEKPPPRSSSSFLSLSCYWEKYVEQFLCLLSFSSFATWKTYWTQLTAFGVSFIYSDGNIRD